MSLKWVKKWNASWKSNFVARGSNIPKLFGLVAWYDFTNSAFLTLSSTAITQALDRSGNGNHTAVQSTGTARPTFTANQKNGLPAAVFDGGDTLAMPSTLYSIPNGNYTLFAVSLGTNNTTQQDVVDFSVVASTTAALRYNIDGVADKTGFWNKSGGIAGGVKISTSGVANANILTVFVNGTTQSISINNAAATSNSNAVASAVNAAYIGSDNQSAAFLTGTIFEILIYNRTLTSSEIIQVNRYLSGKYAITIS